jgi:riboflavin transporter FmnP
MLLVCSSVGVIAGLLIAFVRLNLGMPGHKAFFWMTPVLIARLRGGCKIGTTAGGLFAALTTYALGANLAGGAIGMPMIVLAGIILDWTVNFLEKNKISGLKMILAIGLAGVAANLVCLAKRLILPTGLNPHFIFGVSWFWFRLFSYAFFGFIAGIAAAISARLIQHKH